MNLLNEKAFAKMLGREGKYMQGILEGIPQCHNLKKN